MHCWSSCSRVIRPRYPHLYPHCYPHPPSAGRRAVVSCSPRPSSPEPHGRRAVVSSVILTPILTAILAGPHHQCWSSGPQHLHLKPVMEGDCQNLVRCSEAERCSDCEGPGTAARLGGCRAFGGCSDFEVRATVRALGAAAARLSSSLPRPASVDISVALFQWQHCGGNIVCRRLVVPPCRRRVVVLVASSSPRRRPRRVVVVAASSSSSSSSRRRLVVAASSPSSSSRRRLVVSSPRRVIRPRLYPHPRPSPPVLVVALSCVRLYPTAIFTPRPSPPVLVVAQWPLSSPLSSPESSPPQPSPPHPPSPAPLPETREAASATVRTWHAAAKLGAAATARAWGTAANLGLQRRLGAAASVRAWALQRGGGCRELQQV